MTRDTVIKQNEDSFQNAWEDYWHQATTVKEADAHWKIMWTCVYNACFNAARRMVKGLINSNGEPIQVQDLDGKACEASIKIMMKIKDGTRPGKLSSFVWLWVYGEIFGVKQQRQDQEADYSYFNNVAYEETEDGYSICTCNF